MASSPPTLPSAPPPVPPRSGEQLIEFDRFIDAQIRKTRAQVRTIDVASELIVMAAGALGLFLVAAIFDHWIVTGGLGFWSRLAFFIIGVGAGGYYFATHVLPLIIKRINPVYAAHAIERGQPSLKNNLINFLLFRSHQSELSPWVYEGIEEQAARSLAGVSVDASLDRSKLIRFGYVLLGLVVVAAVYKIASPKDPFQTFGRVLIPWGDIAAPTDVTIVEIEPGQDITVPRGKPAVVAAHVRGLADDGEAWALYSTADGQIIDRKIPLRVASGDYRHMAELPPGGGGAQQPFTYRIQAGDATTKTYKVDVTEAPTIAIDSIEFEYPSYTGFPNHTTERLGDIKALEGTRVTVRAAANQEIGSAQVVFDPRSRLDMKVDGRRASAAWTLALDEDRRAAEHDHYELRFKNQSGAGSEDAALYPIEVIADQSPSVMFTAPEKSQVDVPLDRSVVLEVNASDPDFSLRRVMLRATVDGRSIVDRALLDEAHRGPYVGRFRFSPKKLNLKPGAVVSYWAEAEDNRQPKVNTAGTDHRTLRIIGAGEAPNQPEALAPEHGDGREGDADKDSADRNQGDPNPPRGEEDQPGDAKPQDQKEGGESGEKSQDDNRQPEDAAGDDQPPKKKQSDQKEGGQSGAGQKPGSEGSSENQGGEQGEQSASGDKQQKSQGGESGQSSGEKSDQSAGKNGAAESREPVANDGSEDPKALQRIVEEQNKQQPAKGDPKSGDNKNSQQNPGDPSSADKKPGEKPQDNKAGDKGSDKQDSQQENKSGAQQPKDGGQPDRGNQEGDKKPDQKSDDQKQSPKNEKDKGGQSQSGGAGSSGGSESGGDEQSKGGAGKSQNSRLEKQAGDRSDSQNDGGSSEQSEGGENAAGGDGQGRGDDQSKQNKAVGDKKEGKPGTGQKPGGEPKPAGKASEQNNSQGQPEGDAGLKSGEQSQQPAENAGGQNTPGDRSHSKGASAKQNANPAGEPSPDNKPEGNSTKSKQAPEGMKAEKKPDGDEATSGDQPKPGSPAAGKQGKSAEKSGDADKNQTPRGETGAGDPNEKPMAAPGSRENATNKPRPKSERPGDADQKPSKDEAQSQSNSKHESDSRGDSDGDQSGGGKQGGGQKANQRGSGASGQNTSSDEGAGKSSESGQGEAANRAGDQKADHPTGQQGAQKGNGGSSRSSPDGKQAGGDPTGNREGGQGELPNQPQSDSNDPSQFPGVNSPGGRGVNPTPAAGKQTKDVAPKEDAANLDYSRRATDLALERLKDQLAKEKVDPQLLKDLGWSQNDLRRFIDRWESMRRDAGAGGQRGEAARKELDDSLRSLHLAPRGASLGGAESHSDRSHGLKESRRRDPPPDYDDQFKAYTRGAARGTK